MKADIRKLMAATWWTFSFGAVYLLATAAAAVLPPLIVYTIIKVEQWAGIQTLFDEQTVKLVNNVGTLAAIYASLRGFFVFARIPFMGLKQQRVSHSQGFVAWLDTPQSSDSLEAVRALVDNITDSLGAKRFDDIKLVPEPTAATSEQRGRRTLLLGWLALPYLSHDALRAVVCHEIAHYHASRYTYHRAIWRLSQTISRIRSVAEITLDNALARSREGSNVKEEHSAPLLHMSMAFSVGLISTFSNTFLKRLGPDNHRFEYYCDEFAAEVGSRHGIIEALTTLTVLNCAYIDFVNTFGRGVSDDLSASFKGFVTIWQNNEQNRKRCETIFFEQQPAHPSAADRCSRLGGMINRQTWILQTPSAGPMSLETSTLQSMVDHQLSAEIRTALKRWSDVSAQARRYVTKGRYLQAIPLLRNLCHWRGNDPELHFLLASALCNSAKESLNPINAYRQAIHHCIRSRQLDYESLEAPIMSDYIVSKLYGVDKSQIIRSGLRNCAFGSIQRGRIDIELAYLLYPNERFPFVPLFLAWIYKKMNDYNSLEWVCLEVVRHDPFCATAGCLLAECAARRLSDRLYLREEIETYREYLRSVAERGGDWEMNLANSRSTFVQSTFSYGWHNARVTMQTTPVINQLLGYYEYAERLGSLYFEKALCDQSAQ